MTFTPAMDQRVRLTWVQERITALWSCLAEIQQGHGFMSLSRADINSVAFWVIDGFPEDRKPFRSYGEPDELQALFCATLRAVFALGVEGAEHWPGPSELKPSQVGPA